MVCCLKEEEAKTVIDSGTTCPRCKGKLAIQIEKKFMKKISKLHCPSCDVSWEDISIFEHECQQARFYGHS